MEAEFAKRESALRDKVKGLEQQKYGPYTMSCTLHDSTQVEVISMRMLAVVIQWNHNVSNYNYAILYLHVEHLKCQSV